MKEKITFEKNVPKSYYAKKLGYGSCGTCYLTSNGDVYKEMFSSASDLEENINNLSKYSNSLISFPETLIYDKNGFSGYLMDYFNGLKLSTYGLASKIDINLFIKYMSLLEKAIKDISYDGVTIFDLNFENILYSNEQGLRIIDTDLYEVDLYKSLDYNYENNICAYFETIISYIFQFSCIYFLDNRLNRLYEKCGFNGEILPSEFIYEFTKFLNKNKHTHVKTLSQFRKLGYSYFNLK